MESTDETKTASGPGGLVAGANKGLATIEIQSWTALAVSTVTGYNFCAICKNDLSQPCLSVEKNMQSECSVTWGTCGHGFHTHCLEEWSKMQATCPLDNLPWQVSRIE